MFERKNLTVVTPGNSTPASRRYGPCLQLNIPARGELIDAEQVRLHAVAPVVQCVPTRELTAYQRRFTVIGARLVELIEIHSARLTTDIVDDLMTSERTRGFRAVRRPELEQRFAQLLHDLGNWIGDPRSDKTRVEFGTGDGGASTRVFRSAS